MTPRRPCNAWVDFNTTFQPDTMVGPILYTTPAAVFEDIDYKLYSWPGHGVAKEASYQYNEKEWMLAEEYDQLISDPSDYHAADVPATHGGRFRRLRPDLVPVRLHRVALRRQPGRRLGHSGDGRRAWRSLPRQPAPSPTGDR